MANARNARSAREKAAELRQQHERQQAVRRNLTIAIAAVSVLVLLIGATVTVLYFAQQKRDRDAAASAPPAHLTTIGKTTGVLYDPAAAKAATSPSPSVTPSGSASVTGSPTGSPSASTTPGATATGAAKGTARTTVLVYEDFLCPACKEFESVDGPTLRHYADQGKINLIFRPVALLADRTTTNYSTRAGAAAGAVLAAAPDKWLAYHDALFANQPEEGSAGLPDAQLVDLAVSVGVDRASVESAITTGKYKNWMDAVTSDFEKSYQATPTVLINGKAQDSLATDKLTAALDKAVAG